MTNRIIDIPWNHQGSFELKKEKEATGPRAFSQTIGSPVFPKFKFTYDPKKSFHKDQTWHALIFLVSTNYKEQVFYPIFKLIGIMPNTKINFRFSKSEDINFLIKQLGFDIKEEKNLDNKIVVFKYLEGNQHVYEYMASNSFWLNRNTKDRREFTRKNPKDFQVEYKELEAYFEQLNVNSISTASCGYDKQVDGEIKRIDVSKYGFNEEMNHGTTFGNDSRSINNNNVPYIHEQEMIHQGSGVILNPPEYLGFGGNNMFGSEFNQEDQHIVPFFFDNNNQDPALMPFFPDEMEVCQPPPIDIDLIGNLIDNPSILDSYKECYEKILAKKLIVLIEKRIQQNEKVYLTPIQRRNLHEARRVMGDTNK